MKLKFIGWKFRDWRFEKRKKKQRKKRGFADSDCWEMRSYFSTIVPEMFRELAKMKNGAPQLEFEEFTTFPKDWIEENSKILLAQKKEKGREEKIDVDGEEKFFDRWWFVLMRIAFCLEEADVDKDDIINEYEEEYHKQVFGERDDKLSFKKWWDKNFEVVETDKKGKPKLYRLKTNEPDKDLEEKFWEREKEIEHYREERKNEAFDLIKKYFYCLWD
jgi:hypothetical protein